MDWRSIDPAEVITQVAILLMSVTVHEAAHAWTADRLGDGTARALGRVSFNPLVHLDWFGSLLFPLITLLLPGRFLLGWAKPVPVNPRNLGSPAAHAMVAAAGPISNLLIALLCWIGLQVSLAVGIRYLADVFVFAMLLNVVLAVFNLFPVPPLDGSWILQAFLPRSMAPLFDAIRPYSLLLLCGLLYLGVFSRVLSPILAFVQRFAL